MVQPLLVQGAIPEHVTQSNEGDGQWSRNNALHLTGDIRPVGPGFQSAFTKRFEWPVMLSFATFRRFKLTHLAAAARFAWPKGQRRSAVLHHHAPPANLLPAQGAWRAPRQKGLSNSCRSGGTVVACTVTQLANVQVFWLLKARWMDSSSCVGTKEQIEEILHQLMFSHKQVGRHFCRTFPYDIWIRDVKKGEQSSNGWEIRMLCHNYLKPNFKTCPYNDSFVFLVVCVFGRLASCVLQTLKALVSSFRSLPFAAIMSLVPLNKSKISTNCIFHRVQTPTGPLGYHYFWITSSDQRWFLAEYASSLYDFESKACWIEPPKKSSWTPGNSQTKRSTKWQDLGELKRTIQ